jgi:hypothetical protein
MISAIRIRRVIMLLGTKEMFSAHEWGRSRELLNRTFRDFRELTKLLVNKWLPITMESVDPEEVRAGAATLPSVVRTRNDLFHRLRGEVEVRRLQIAVKPDGYPAVRPPRYFGGDLLDEGAWRIYSAEINGLIDSLDHGLEA